MKDLLLKRKTAFSIYVIACFFPVITDLLGNWSFALLVGSIEKKDMAYFIQVSWLCIAICLFGVFMFYASRFLRIGFMRDTILDVRLNAFNRILKLSYDTFNKQSKEIYISNLINDINTFEQNFFLKLINIIFQGGKYTVSVILLLILDFKFGLGTIAISLLVYYFSIQFEKKTIHMQQEVSQANENFTVEASNTLNGLEILKLNQVEDKFLYKTLKSIDQVELKKLRFAVFTEGQRGITRFISNFVFVGMIIYLLNQAFNGISLTRVAFLLQLAGGCIWPIGYVIPMFNELKASISIYQKITAAPEDSSEASHSAIPYGFDHSIEVKNLTFAYEGKNILNKVNFTLEKGKKYLIKGASGAGKSTMIKLLSKIYNHYEGDILIDGKPLATIDDQSFNAHIAFIYQDVFLFEDSILNNITLFKSGEQERLEQVISQAGLQDLIDSREEGISAQLSENGKNLSGGQRQRISIARAIYKEADLLFVDEGTSSLNEELGRSIEATILGLNSTVLAISHRYYPGVTEAYDYVLEISDGQVIQYLTSDYFEEVAI